MKLRFDLVTGSYLGERLEVPADLFEDVVDELVEGGVPEAEARRRLLEESFWLDIEGTTQFQPLWLCLECRALVPDQRRFCDAVCEAAFIAEVHG